MPKLNWTKYKVSAFSVVIIIIFVLINSLLKHEFSLLGNLGFVDKKGEEKKPIKE